MGATGHFLHEEVRVAGPPFLAALLLLLDRSLALGL